jgi:predicted O-linked N-acetylglucosamine transferase (SPINDLY family)
VHLLAVLEGSQIVNLVCKELQVQRIRESRCKVEVGAAMSGREVEEPRPTSTGSTLACLNRAPLFKAGIPYSSLNFCRNTKKLVRQADVLHDSRERRRIKVSILHSAKA